MIHHMLKYTDTVDRPVLNVSGDVDRFRCNLMDVTERKQAQDVREALGQAEAGLALVSRDLRAVKADNRSEGRGA
jgi:hypothetical protein